MKFKSFKQKLELSALSLLLTAGDVLAQGKEVKGYYDEYATSSTSHIYRILTGGLGSFIIVFMGLGGMASLFITRGKGSQKETPIMGVIMVLIAVGLFSYRILIRAGMLGHEYLEW
jgi:hypothetical protein